MRKLKFSNTAVTTVAYDWRAVRQGLLVSMLIFIFSALAVRGAAAQTTTAPTTPALTSVVDGLNLPWGVQILQGTAISPVTGAPVRHVWEGDQAGFCRVDPDLDSPGPFAVNPNTCVTSVAGVAFTPGRTAFDPTNNNLYTVNNAKPQSVARLHFLPDGDSGQGVINLLSSEFLGDTNGCGVSGNFPWAIALGPDGNLYLSFRKNGNLVRVLAPQSPSVPCSSFQVFGSTADAKIGKGVSWIGHDLWGADGIGVFRIANADQCFTPANNFTACKGINLLVALVPNPLGIFSDQVYPAVNGNNLYVFDPTGTSITLISGVNTAEPTVQTSWVPSILGGLTIAVDNSNPANQVLYLGSDPAVDAPAVVNQGWIDKISHNAPTLPDPPNNASAAPGDGRAIASWSVGGGGTPTSFTVHNSFASNGLVVPDVTVSAAAGSTFVPTVATITGLIDGVSYQFEISASNSFGTSPFSLPSNLVTPHAVTVPTAPPIVIASPAIGAATVAWSTPASDGGSPIISYTVTAYVGGVPAGAGVIVLAPATSAVVSGLTNGTTYTFTVHATNAAGNSPESAASNAVTPNLPLGPTDIAVSMSAPATVNAGGNVSYTLTVSNLGPNFAPSLVTTNPIPAGATFVSASTSLGVCAGPSTSSTGGVQCLASGLLPGSSITITVTLNVAASTTNSASVQAFDAAGNPLLDPNPINNASFATTTVGPPPSTTDIQVTGSAQNGGPAVGTIDTFTWQIKDNLSIAANGVTFSTTLPASVPFQSVTTNLGTCSGPLPGTSGTVTCAAPTLAGGQTMVVIVNVFVAASGTIPVVGAANLFGTDTNIANNVFTVIINAK